MKTVGGTTEVEASGAGTTGMGHPAVPPTPGERIAQRLVITALAAGFAVFAASLVVSFLGYMNVRNELRRLGADDLARVLPAWPLRLQYIQSGLGVEQRSCVKVGEADAVSEVLFSDGAQLWLKTADGSVSWLPNGAPVLTLASCAPQH